MTAPLDLLQTDVRPDWIDYNDHMNVAYYVMVFDQAMDEFLNLYGLGKAYTLGGHGSVFALQNHVHYMREVSVGTRLGVNLQLLDLDAKRIHVFFRMRDLSNDQVVSTSEFLCIHVNVQTRRSAVFPAPQRQQLDVLFKDHSKLTKPEVAGRRIGAAATL